MARIPSPEHILLQIHQSLGLERPASKHINQFTQLRFPLQRQKKFMEDLLTNIFSSLEMDEQARTDARENIREWFEFDIATAAHVWTHEASQQQVLWHMLAYSWVPGLARRLAFWDLAGMQRGIPFDAGMPGGAFWFLPTWDQSAGTVRLPVEGVLEWLLDLLGNQSIEHAASALQREQAQRKNMNALRTLQGWRLEGTLPQSAKMIDELFHDEAELDFRGSFDLSDDVPAVEQLAAAIEFVHRRELAPKTLAHEIPLQTARLHAIVAGNGSTEENNAFVRALAIRYATPSMQTVRQRLRVARMAQDAYKRLLKSLCGSGLDSRCADPSRNRLLPMLALFHTVYNLTIQSSGHGSSNAEQDSWFESRFAPWDRLDLLLGIMPSARGFGYRLLGERLTRRFMTFGPDAPLPDLVPFAEAGQASSTVLERIRMLRSEADEDSRIEALRNAAATLPASETQKAVCAETSYLVMSQLAVTSALPAEVRAMAVDHIRKLAGTPAQVAGALITGLAMMLDSSTPARTYEAHARVGALLQELEACDTAGIWKAPFLRFRARYRLMLNDFEGAVADFRAALQACLDRNYGSIQADVAKECLATEVAMRGLDRKTQDYLYRHLVPPAWAFGRQHSFEDTAVFCEDFFWSSLYQPCNGVAPRSRQFPAELKDLVTRSIKVIHDGDMSRLRSWLLQHEKELRPLRMNDIRKDSLLLLWMKQLTLLEKMERMPVILGGLRRGKQLPCPAIRKAIRLLVELWPEQARTFDFKQQTPLMIAADNGDPELTALLASLSDIDAQDYIGRTALHAAVSGGASKCVELVLDSNPDVDKVTVDEEQTALHTAVRFGNLKAVSLIADAFPCRLEKKNGAEMTPLEMARNLLENLDEWREFMRQQNRRIGSKEEFRAVISRLETSLA